MRGAGGLQHKRESRDWTCVPAMVEGVGLRQICTQECFQPLT